MDKLIRAIQLREGQLNKASANDPRREEFEKDLDNMKKELADLKKQQTAWNNRIKAYMEKNGMDPNNINEFHKIANQYDNGELNID